MADRTGIKWTEATWNPIRARNKKTGKVGNHCEHVNEACVNCYAEKLNLLRGTGLEFRRQDRDKIEIFLDPKMMQWPLRWKRSRKIFLTSMSDVAAEFVTDNMLDQLWAVMALSPQHTFQVLTKRPARLNEYLHSRDGLANPAVCAAVFAIPYRLGNRRAVLEMPLPNVWLGTSVHDQESANAFIPLLLDTPAVKRFISYEPALGPIDLTALDNGSEPPVNALKGHAHELPDGVPGLDWVIAGGESGVKARDFNIEWARDVMAQCARAGVACFVKQLGSKPVEVKSVPSEQTNRRDIKLKDRMGGDWGEWPEDLRVRQFPAT